MGSVEGMTTPGQERGDGGGREGRAEEEGGVGVQLVPHVVTEGRTQEFQLS